MGSLLLQGSGISLRGSGLTATRTVRNRDIGTGGRKGKRRRLRREKKDDPAIGAPSQAFSCWPAPCAGRNVPSTKPETKGPFVGAVAGHKLHHWHHTWGPSQLLAGTDRRPHVSRFCRNCGLVACAGTGRANAPSRSLRLAGRAQLLTQHGASPSAGGRPCCSLPIAQRCHGSFLRSQHAPSRSVHHHHTRGRCGAKPGMSSCVCHG